uniref:Small multidrug resistance pump n=1 Tax=Candidatus Kentrum sp. FW TaxID=2126338 RepID=A0A450TUZ6_9GAMM|nr:MAG: small multidrug resistance pump [Candidatus Kentron sp. FW]
MGYLYLSIAIAVELIATSMLKISDGSTKIIPSLIGVTGYISVFYFMSIVVKYIPIGIAYAIWSGLGIIGISLVGMFFFKQFLDTPAIIGMALIVLGIIIINVFSESVSV